MDGDAGWTDGWTDGTHNKIKNTSKPTTTSTWNPNNSKQRDQHSQNNVKMQQQHAMYDNTKHAKKRKIHATGKEAQNPQNHNQPSQTEQIEKQRQRQLHFTGASVQTTIKQLTTQPHTDKIPKNNPAPPRQTPPRETIPRGQDGNVLPRRQCSGVNTLPCRRGLWLNFIDEENTLGTSTRGGR